MEAPAFDIYNRLYAGANIKSISSWFSQTYNLPPNESTRFIKEIDDYIGSLDKKNNKSQRNYRHENIVNNTEFHSEKFYRFAGSSFHIQYGTQQIETLLHPLIAHMETNNPEMERQQIHICKIENNLVLNINQQFAGRWGIDEAHLLKGKVFMQFLNSGFQKEENDWMAVTHAATISDGSNCILVPGESGSGKSTMTALLQAHGFNVLSDDFTPIEAKTGNAYPFPLGISIKKGAINTINKYYPEIEDKQEYILNNSSKIVRYLYPPISDGFDKNNYNIKAIVFVKYEKGSKLKLRKKPADKAFKILVTESWLSPIYKNAQRFLNWFESKPCYQLTYSDTKELVASIRNIFNNEL